MILSNIYQFLAPLILGFILYWIMGKWNTKRQFLASHKLELIGKLLILMAVMVQLAGVGKTSDSRLEVEQLQVRNIINTINTSRDKITHYDEAVALEIQSNQNAIMEMLVIAIKKINLNWDLTSLNLETKLNTDIDIDIDIDSSSTELRNSLDGVDNSNKVIGGTLAWQLNRVWEDLSKIDLIAEENKDILSNLQSLEAHLSDKASGYNLFFLTWFLIGSFFLIFGRILEIRDELESSPQVLEGELTDTT